ncbi:MAG: type II toxin-antitoxin system RelE/ParE family toxin [Saprospiraceae bacterium]|nr:type II toxin-antitoxin system RelE/ParE family toxin [Saprospiraceae bacterium]
MTFLGNLPEKPREKIIYNINKATLVNSKELFKKLTDDIWEFRTIHNKTYYRMLAFWDKTGTTDTLVISTHGMIKKTRKIPKSEILKAERVMIEYFNQK